MALIEKNNKLDPEEDTYGQVIRPKNGQKALDNSIAFKQTPSSRVSVSDGQFVVLTKTKNNVSHGYVESWDGLELAMQDALINAGLVTSCGKIVCKN